MAGATSGRRGSVEIGVICLATPDQHLLLETGRVRVTRGRVKIIAGQPAILCFAQPLALMVREWLA